MQALVPGLAQVLVREPVFPLALGPSFPPVDNLVQVPVLVAALAPTFLLVGNLAPVPVPVAALVDILALQAAVLAAVLAQVVEVDNSTAPNTQLQSPTPTAHPPLPCLGPPARFDPRTI